MTNTATAAASARGELGIRHELIIVDPRVPGHERLAGHAPSGRDDEARIDVVVLDPARDGVEQITDILDAHRRLDALHIVSRGSDGAVPLGRARLTAANLLDYNDLIVGWGGALASTARLFVHGCDLGATSAGRSLVDALSSFTGTPVAPSDDSVVLAALVGDWHPGEEAGAFEEEAVVDEPEVAAADAVEEVADGAEVLAADEVELVADDTEVAVADEMEGAADETEAVVMDEPRADADDTEVAPAFDLESPTEDAGVVVADEVNDVVDDTEAVAADEVEDAEPVAAAEIEAVAAEVEAVVADAIEDTEAVAADEVEDAEPVAAAEIEDVVAEPEAVPAHEIEAATDDTDVVAAEQIEGAADEPDVPVAAGIIDDAEDNEDAAPTALDLHQSPWDEPDAARPLDPTPVSATTADPGAPEESGVSGALTLDLASPAQPMSTLTVQAKDGGGRVFTASFCLVVGPIDAPSPNAIATGGRGAPDDADSLTFTVERLPVRGRLSVGTMTLARGDTFTRSDVDRACLAYEFTGHASARDGFCINVADGSGQQIRATVAVVVDVRPAPSPTATFAAALGRESLTLAALTLGTLEALAPSAQETRPSDLPSIGGDGWFATGDTINVAFENEDAMTTALVGGYAVSAERGAPILASALALLPALPSHESPMCTRPEAAAA